MRGEEDWPLEYEPIDIVGEGAQARVFKLRHRTTGERVAAKRFTERDFKALGRVEREIQALRLLRHPSIVTFLGVEQTRSGGFILTELVEGTSLAKLLETSGPLTPGRALRLSVRLADALAHAAARGVVHRDVTPSNILLCVHDVPKLTDFGCATLGDANVKKLTGAGEWIGTPYYMAPEQFMSDAVDARTDVWGLAASMFEAVTGEVPFPGKNATELSHRIRKTPVELAKLSAILGLPAAQLFARCLEKRLEDRPQPDEVAVELAKLVHRRETETAV